MTRCPLGAVVSGLRQEAGQTLVTIALPTQKRHKTLLCTPMTHQTTLDLLKTLVAFDTTSRNSNLELIEFIVDYLSGLNIDCQLVRNRDGDKANLYATIGPTDRPGVMLSGHTDVVPIDGQSWSVPAFELTTAQARAYGRGTADMKGFIASALHTCQLASSHTLKTPLHLALSFDEEIGCIGVHSLLELLAGASIQPMMCIVGEPTNLKVATGHKGKIALTAKCVGSAGHSALAPKALNAIHLATDFIAAIRDLQVHVRDTHHHDSDYGVPYTTLHVGKINGGVAVNIVPDSCIIEFEIRNVAEDSLAPIIGRLNDAATHIVNLVKDDHPAAHIEITEAFSYPGLMTPKDAAVVDFVKSLTGENDTMKVAFGTEAGLFTEKLDIPSVVCGPGSMDQGHKPDEFIELSELDKCDRMLSKLVDHLVVGITA